MDRNGDDAVSDYLATARAYVSRRSDEEDENDEETGSYQSQGRTVADLGSSSSSPSSPLVAFDLPWLEQTVVEEKDGVLACPTARRLPLSTKDAAKAAAWADELDRLEPAALDAFIRRHTILKAAVREVVYRRALTARARQLEAPRGD